MPSRTRPRVERAQSTAGTSDLAAIRQQMRENLPDIAGMYIEQAKHDPDIAKELLGMFKDEFTRAQAAEEDTLLQEVAKVRAAGSPLMQQYWDTVYVKAQR